MAQDLTSSYAHAAPKTKNPRPELPIAKANQNLLSMDPTRPPPVKFQVITREGQDIVVGRVKIPTPNASHAFILRRFDTGAISLTTMYRAAFPSAGDELERQEAAWVKANYDNPGANGSASATNKLRLAGTWIAVNTALTLAPDYKLQHVLPPLIVAKPEDGANYRKSTKGSSPTSPAASTVAPEALSSPTVPPPAKRRKESSPAPAPTRSSTRLKSPPVQATSPRASTPRSGRGTRTSTRVARAPVVASPTPMEEDDDAPEIPGVDPDTDIAESKQLVENLKAARQRVRAAVNEAENPLKRTTRMQREGEAVPLVREMRLDGDGAGLEVARPIASNRRINIALNSEQKALAWGTLAFAFGMGLTSYILPLFS